MKPSEMRKLTVAEISKRSIQNELHEAEAVYVEAVERMRTECDRSLENAVAGDRSVRDARVYIDSLQLNVQNYAADIIRAASRAHAAVGAIQEIEKAEYFAIDTK